MPVHAVGSYKAPLFLPSGHLQTIVPHLMRRVRGIVYERRRILTQDQDFLDLDWLRTGASRAAIITHGLEGSSRSVYVRGMAKTLAEAGWDVLCWNMRGCSGELNRLPGWYHAGLTDDLARVFSHVLFSKRYRDICLVGFSLGGALTLNFLGEQGAEVSSLVRNAVVFSVPCDLESSANELAKGMNRLYTLHLLRSLRAKIIAKSIVFPNVYRELTFEGVRTFREFDGRFTAPLHGFKDAQEYWRQCSPNRVLRQICVPTLIVNAANDPFLGTECYPRRELQDHAYVKLEVPEHGGHAGFLSLRGSCYWSEQRALEFLEADGGA